MKRVSSKFCINLILVSCLIITSHDMVSQNLQISGGNTYSVALCENATVYAWGQNGAGQLGPGGGGGATSPILVTGFPVGTIIRQVDAGSGSHVVAVSCNGEVWTWGENKCAQLGRGGAAPGTGCDALPTSANSTPQRVVGGAQGGAYLTNIIYVSGGNNASYAIESGTGRVLAWGRNEAGELGDQTYTNRAAPVYVRKCDGTFLTNIVQIEGGDEGAYALDASGQVWSWGSNNSEALGGSGGANCAARVQACLSFNPSTGCTVGNLTNIIMISAGDRHGLALDRNGNVWGWGGDWGPGQRGNGGNYQAQSYAIKVVDVGVCGNDSWQTGPYLGNGVDGKVVFIAASQASSAAVMENGKVVTWGANGFFKCTTGNSVQSGILGNGTSTVNSPTTCTTVDATSGSECPVRVRNNSGTDLTNIKSVSDGDGWFFAVAENGTAYSWGYNGEGQLGNGTTTSRNNALAFTLPSGCTLLNPCPTKPDLGPDMSVCPITSTVLSTTVSGSTFVYTWQRATSLAGPWTTVSGPTTGAAGETYTATQPGYYRLLISDNRGAIPATCGPCAQVGDTIQLIQINPPASLGVAGVCGSDVCFQIANDPAADDPNAFDWWTSYTGGTKRNTTPTNPFCTPQSGLTGCPTACQIWVEDRRTYTGIDITTAPSCPPASYGGPFGFDRKYTRFTVSRPVTLISVDIMAASFSYPTTSGQQYRVRVYNDNPSGLSGTGDIGTTLLYTSPTYTVPAGMTGPTLHTIPMNFTLPSGGIYWLRGENVSNGNVTEMTCTGAYPYVDNTGQNLVTATKSVRDGGNTTQAPLLFNVRFRYDKGYPCGRFLVTAPGSTACLPVEFLSLNAYKHDNAVSISWSAISETKILHFDVMKSSDGIHWIKIGSVKANENINTPQNYQYTDLYPLAGQNYYKVVAVDTDQASSHSNIEIVYFSQEVFSVVPNPSNGIFSLSTILQGKFKIEVCNALGQLVFNSSEYNSSLLFEKEYNLSYLSKGVYTITISDQQHSYRSKIVLE